MAKNYKGIGKGRYKATSGKRKGKVFTMGKGGSHVYKKGRKTVTIHKGGRRTVSVAKGKPRDTFNPLAPRTGKQYESELKAATELEFGDTERELATQRRNTGQHMTNVGDWWGGYQRDLEAARQRQQQGDLMAAGMVQGQANKGFAQDTISSAMNQQAEQKQAALRGATVDPSLHRQAVQAAGSNRTQTSNMAAGLAGYGAAQNTLMADRIATAGGQRAQALENVRSQQGKLDEEGRAIQTKKGAFKQRFRSETIDKERQYAAVQKEFGLDVATEASRARDRAADNRRQKAKDRQTKRDQDRRYQHDREKFGADEANRRWERRWKQAHPPGSGKGKGKGKGKGMSSAGYGKTSVTRAKAVENRRKWESMRAGSTTKDKWMEKVGMEMNRLGGKLSKRTAQKVYRIYGIRLPYHKKGKGRTGDAIKRAGKGLF